MWDIFLWENIMLTEEMVGRETVSWLPVFTTTRESWGQAALCEGNLFVTSASPWHSRVAPRGEAETVSHSAVATEWLNHCAEEKENAFVISRVSTVLPCQCCPVALSVSCSGHGDCQSPSSHRSPHQGALWQGTVPTRVPLSPTFPLSSNYVANAWRV